MGVLLLPMIKMTRESITSSDPFHEEFYEQMGYVEYSVNYMKYGLECIFGLLGEQRFGGDAERFRVYSNNGECSHSLYYILGYTVC